MVWKLTDDDWQAVLDMHLTELRAEIPMGRFSAPEKACPIVGFLASEQAGYITGVVVPVDGGLSI